MQASGAATAVSCDSISNNCSSPIVEHQSPLSIKDQKIAFSMTWTTGSSPNPNNTLTLDPHSDTHSQSFAPAVRWMNRLPSLPAEATCLPVASKATATAPPAHASWTGSSRVFSVPARELYRVAMVPSILQVATRAALGQRCTHAPGLRWQATCTTIWVGGGMVSVKQAAPRLVPCTGWKAGVLYGLARPAAHIFTCIGTSPLGRGFGPRHS